MIKKVNFNVEKIDFDDIIMTSCWKSRELRRKSKKIFLVHFDCRGGTSKGALAKKVEKQNSKQHFTSSDLGVNTFENCSSLKQGAMVNRDQSKFSYDIHILMDNRYVNWLKQDEKFRSMTARTLRKNRSNTTW